MAVPALDVVDFYSSAELDEFDTKTSNPNTPPSGTGQLFDIQVIPLTGEDSLDCRVNSSPIAFLKFCEKFLYFVHRRLLTEEF